MEMNITLHITLSECSTITIDPCKKIKKHYKGKGYSLSITDNKITSAKSTVYIHSKKYLSLYKDLCKKAWHYFPNRNDLQYKLKQYSCKLQIQKDTCVSIHILSTTDTPDPVTLVKLPNYDNNKYVFQRASCGYIFITTIMNSSSYNQLMVFGKQISTNLEQKPHITVLQKREYLMNWYQIKIQ